MQPFRTSAFGDGPEAVSRSGISGAIRSHWAQLSPMGHVIAPPPSSPWCPPPEMNKPCDRLLGFFLNIGIWKHHIPFKPFYYLGGEVF